PTWRGNGSVSRKRSRGPDLASAAPVLDLDGKRVWVAGHRGLVGSAIVRRLEREPIGELITATSEELDLREQAPTHAFASERQPEIVLLAAATAGGINANRSE